MNRPMQDPQAAAKALRRGELLELLKRSLLAQRNPEFDTGDLSHKRQQYVRVGCAVLKRQVVLVSRRSSI